ncbi:transmembrane protease serine 13-like [Mesocricetus auratus]|uniref:Transmembrane protease serine 13-like n=1 Tax=Mesocricetus auratus TaxID=10036 RepID=A0ABM2XJ96_MESAU|nr:transmembrane protease serine 13-like [Mesocricetus auratus]XP_040602821.1 transmembrane protease serine 13-like [Mesocricetus auratus]
MSPAFSAAARPTPGAASAQSAAPPGRLRPAAAVPSRHRAASRAPTDERAGTRGARARAGPRLVCCLPARRHAGRTRAAQGPRCPPARRSAPTTRAPPRLDSPSRTRPQLFPPRASPPLRVPGTAPLPLLGAVTRAGARVVEQPIRVGRYRAGRRGLKQTARGAHPGLSTAGAGAADPGPRSWTAP